MIENKDSQNSVDFFDEFIKLEESIKTINLDKAKIVEASIHTLIDNLNPFLRKETEAKTREF
jgi:hypothetical protein